MRGIVMAFVLVCGAILQAILPTGRIVAETRVPVLLGLVVYYALTRERGAAMRAAVLAGFLQDGLGLVPLGYSAFCFCVCAWFINRVREEVFVFHWITHVLFGGLASGVVSLAMYILLTQGGELNMGLKNLMIQLLGTMFVGALSTPFVFKAAVSLEEKLGLIKIPESI